MIWQLTTNKEWAALEKEFSWVADMQRVAQHKEHHGEGDVAAHTRMVLSELQEIPAYQLLDKQAQEILWTAALLHDVEKRSTSVNNGEGVISAEGHARKGEYTARNILFKDIPAPFQIREQIATLVRFHSLPLWLMEKAEPEKRLFEAAMRVNTQYLKIIAEADIRGRICRDKKKLLESLEIFELFCREQGCWGKSREFATSAARFHYFNTENSYVDYTPFEHFKCEVTLLAGLPGMGKDHYIRSLKTDMPVISLDDMRRKHKIEPTDKSGNGRIIQMAKEEARICLRKGEDFIWNATNITRKMRTQLIDLFTSYNARVKIVYIEKPYDIWRKQNKEREYPVPEQIMNKMLSKLEIPHPAEAHEVEYVV